MSLRATVNKMLWKPHFLRLTHLISLLLQAATCQVNGLLYLQGQRICHHCQAADAHECT